MFEEHKEKKAAEAHEKAVADWQALRDAYSGLLDIAQHYSGTTADSLMLAKGEAVFYKVTDASLVEERRGPGHYAGHSQGISIPIAHVAGRPIRYRVGVNKGHFVQGTPTPTAIDTGTVFITNRRVIFQGTKQTRECAFPKLIGFEGDDKDGSTTFSVANRQKPTTIHYGPSLSAAFDFRLDLALAHFRGDVDSLVLQLQDELAELDAHRPPDLAVDPPSPVPASYPARPSTYEAPQQSPTPLSESGGGPGARLPENIPTEARPAANPTAAPIADPSLQAQLPNPPNNPSAPVQAPPPAEHSAGVQAGWYTDPWKVAPWRWWDGSEWTGYLNNGRPPASPLS